MIQASNERNIKIHYVSAVCALIMCLMLNVRTFEWLIIFHECISVISAEYHNTAIERLADRVNGKRDKKIGEVKNIAAGSVAPKAIRAAIVGFVIFTPKIMLLAGVPSNNWLIEALTLF